MLHSVFVTLFEEPRRYESFVTIMTDIFAFRLHYGQIKLKITKLILLVSIGSLQDFDAPPD